VTAQGLAQAWLNAFQARPLAALRTESEPDLDLYGASQDFSIWSARP
jgi:hypothetical protein